MPRVTVTPRPGLLWYVEWDGTNLEDVVSCFPPEVGVDFQVDEETNDLVVYGNHYPVGSAMTYIGGVNAMTNVKENYQEVSDSVIPQFVIVDSTES